MRSWPNLTDFWMNHGAHRKYTHLKWPKNFILGFPSPSLHLWFSDAVWNSPPPSRPSWRLSPGDIYMQKVVVHPGEFRFKKRSSTYTIPNKHDGILRQISPFKGWQVTSCDVFFAPIFFFSDLHRSMMHQTENYDNPKSFFIVIAWRSAK